MDAIQCRIYHDIRWLTVELLPCLHLNYNKHILDCYNPDLATLFTSAHLALHLHLASRAFRHVNIADVVGFRPYTGKRVGRRGRVGWSESAARSRRNVAHRRPPAYKSRGGLTPVVFVLLNNTGTTATVTPGATPEL